MSTDTVAGTASQRLTRLAEEHWRGRAADHHDRVEAWVGDRRARRSVGRRHPVDDFLFDYYPYSTGRLQAWHPGHGVELGGEVSEYLAHPDYRPTGSGATTDAARLIRHRQRLDVAVRVLESTAGRQPQLGCFGLHEWAMVYGQAPTEVRHSAAPLRLSPAGIVDVVDDLGLRCTHIDAYRFFTDAALPLNAHRPTREDQHEWDQPGCLHANMDLYKYAMWFSPFVGSDLIADCFALARLARDLDMRASPYDVADFGLEPIRIETAEGRREFAARQRDLMSAAEPIRTRLLGALRDLHDTAT